VVVCGGVGSLSSFWNGEEGKDETQGTTPTRLTETYVGFNKELRRV